MFAHGTNKHNVPILVKRRFFFFSRFSHVLPSVQWDFCLAVGCLHNDVPCGYAIALLEGGRVATLLQMEIACGCRRLGYGGQLLDFLKEALRKAGVSQLQYSFSTSVMKSMYMIGFLEKHGFSQPEVNQVRYLCDTRDFLQALEPTVKKMALPPDIHLESFANIQAHTRTHLDTMARTGTIPPFVLPQSVKGMFLPAQSFYLMKQGHLVFACLFSVFQSTLYLSGVYLMPTAKPKDMPCLLHGLYRGLVEQSSPEVFAVNGCGSAARQLINRFASTVPHLQHPQYLMLLNL